MHNETSNNLPVKIEKFSNSTVEMKCEMEQKIGWCLLSERRLLQKLITHKPAGVNRQFNIILLNIYMNNIFDFEEDTNFEDYLSESDFELLKKRRQEGKIDPKNPMSFSPNYAIRPTVKQIEEKLNEYYDIELIQENELTPEGLEKERVFENDQYSLNS